MIHYICECVLILFNDAKCVLKGSKEHIWTYIGNYVKKFGLMCLKDSNVWEFWEMFFNFV